MNIWHVYHGIMNMIQSTKSLLKLEFKLTLYFSKTNDQYSNILISMHWYSDKLWLMQWVIHDFTFAKKMPKKYIG